MNSIQRMDRLGISTILLGGAEMEAARKTSSKINKQREKETKRTSGKGFDERVETVERGSPCRRQGISSKRRRPTKRYFTTASTNAR